jgi:hypothetical protein
MGLRMEAMVPHSNSRSKENRLFQTRWFQSRLGFSQPVEAPEPGSAGSCSVVRSSKEIDVKLMQPRTGRGVCGKCVSDDSEQKA